MPTSDRTWNVMMREPDKAHFVPIWYDPVTEVDARIQYEWRTKDSYFGRNEHQLVRDFSGHWVNVQRRTAQGTYPDQDFIIDGWTAVPVDA